MYTVMIVALGTLPVLGAEVRIQGVLLALQVRRVRLCSYRCCVRAINTSEQKVPQGMNARTTVKKCQKSER